MNSQKMREAASNVSVESKAMAMHEVREASVTYYLGLLAGVSLLPVTLLGLLAGVRRVACNFAWCCATCHWLHSAVCRIGRDLA